MSIPTEPDCPSMNLGQAVAVCCYDLVRDALADYETFSSVGLGFNPMVNEALQGTSLASDPPAHTRVRRLANVAFTPRRVAKPGKIAWVSDLSAEPPVVRVQRRGNPEDEGVEVAPASFSWAKHAGVNFGDNAMPEGQRRRERPDGILGLRGMESAVRQNQHVRSIFRHCSPHHKRSLAAANYGGQMRPISADSGCIGTVSNCLFQQTWCIINKD